MCSSVSLLPLFAVHRVIGGTGGTVTHYQGRPTHYVQLGGRISALKLKGGTLLIFLKNLSAGISTKIGVQLNFHMTKKNLGSKISKVTHLIVKNDIEDDECS